MTLNSDVNPFLEVRERWRQRSCLGTLRQTTPSLTSRTTLAVCQRYGQLSCHVSRVVTCFRCPCHQTAPRRSTRNGNPLASQRCGASGVDLGGGGGRRGMEARSDRPLGKNSAPKYFCRWSEFCPFQQCCVVVSPEGSNPSLPHQTLDPPAGFE